MKTRTITKINAVKLATGMQALLLDMTKSQGEDFKGYPVESFEAYIETSKQVSREEAEKVTEAIINTGIIRWDLCNNTFVL